MQLELKELGETLDGGGASGGGSINIFYMEDYEVGTISVKGGNAVTGCKNGSNSGTGGNGTISIGTIKNGTYVSSYKNY